MSFKNTN